MTQLVLTHRGGEESGISICHTYKGKGGLTHLTTYAEAPFGYQTLLSLMTAFSTVVQRLSYDHFPVSQMFYSLVVYIISDCIYEHIPVRNGRGFEDQIGKSTYTMEGIVASVHVRTIGGGGQIFDFKFLSVTDSYQKERIW